MTRSCQAVSFSFFDSSRPGADGGCGSSKSWGGGAGGRGGPGARAGAAWGTVAGALVRNARGTVGGESTDFSEIDTQVKVRATEDQNTC